MLPPAEQQAYRLLVRSDGVTSGDHGLTREMLESLHSKGLATPGPVYRALPPDLALGDALLRRQESLEAARQMVAALSEEYRSTTRRRSAEHLVEIVVGAGALRQRLREMQDAAREEILWFCRANPIAMQGPENEEEGSALGRGVRYRAIYERELLEKPGELASIMQSVRDGEEARTLPALPVRLAIADRSLAVCPLVPDANRGLGPPTAALIRSSELLDALLALFDRYWAVATPLGAPAEPAELSEAEVLLLSLVVSGMPDKSIATHLGVSKRTVQRRLERLMNLAGVDTRTGLAFQAARRAWLT